MVTTQPQPRLESTPSHSTVMPDTPQGKTLPLPQSTPIKVDTSTTLPFTTTQKYRVKSYTAMAEEMAKYLVGPMPAQQFLDEFFPIDDLPGLQSVPSFARGCYRAAVMAEKETSAYKHFVSTSMTSLFFLLIDASLRSRQQRISLLAFLLSIHLDLRIVTLGWIFRSRSSLILLSILPTRLPIH